MKTLKKMWVILSLRNRRSALVLLLLMVIGMCFETLGVGLIIPLISIFTQENLSTQYPEVIPLINLIGNPEKETLFVYAMVFLLGLYVVKNIFLAILVWIQMRFVFEVRTYLAKKLFSTYIRQPYMFHLQNNSAQLIRNITNEISAFIAYGVLPLLQIFSEGLVLIGIVIFIINRTQ